MVSASAMLGAATPVQAEDAGPGDRDTWIADALQTKGLTGALYLSRFIDPIYFLTKPIEWHANDGSQDPVAVPAGFVTDFASIPQVFWSALRPDGDYAQAAVVHDYLYWTQGRSRALSDAVFRSAMVDLEVSPAVVTTLFEAVHLFGAGAWAENARLKAAGERRVLKKYPQSPVRWAAWKSQADVFL